MAKVTSEELQKLKAYQSQIEEAASEYSNLTVQLALLKKRVVESRDKLYKAIDGQEFHLKKLHEKYGDGSLDIETGEITS